MTGYKEDHAGYLGSGREVGDARCSLLLFKLCDRTATYLKVGVYVLEGPQFLTPDTAVPSSPKTARQLEQTPASLYNPELV